MRWVKWLAILVIAGAAVAAGLTWRKRNATVPVKYTTVAADRGRIVARVTATGTLSALVTVQVGSQVSGRIAEIAADFNSVVTKGQVIAKIDPQLFVAAIEQARANFLAAEANLKKAKVQAADMERQYTRAKALRDEKLIAQADTDTAQANYDAARAQIASANSSVAQAKASLHQMEINLEYSTIHSPINGVVISRNVDVGQTVAASLQAPTLFTIAEDLKKMQVDTNVAEADVGKLKSGMPASFSVDAYPSEKFRGKVRQIRNAPQTVQNVVTYDAVIDVDNTELKLKPGMTANITFIYAEKDDVLKVPNAALRFKPPPDPAAAPTPPVKRDRNAPLDQRTVYVLQGGKPAMVAVRVGISDGSQSEVVEGALSAGDAVITELVDGTRPAGAGPPGGMGGGAGAFRRGL